MLSEVYFSRQTGLCAVNDDRSAVATDYALSLQFC